jgi:hypothetical protein
VDILVPAMSATLLTTSAIWLAWRPAVAAGKQRRHMHEHKVSAYTHMRWLL